MQDLIKSKLVYYFAVPVLLGIWTLYNSLIMLPDKYELYNNNVKDWHTAQPLMAQIITLAPERLIQAKEKTVDFDYDRAIAKTAGLCGISMSKITPNIRGKRTQNKQDVQEATISINEIKISQFAKFLAISLHLWPDLQCERLKLTKLSGPKDSWKTDLSFRYFY